jgi:hypothetical protein
MIAAALFGGFLGLYFTQQAQHHKWLLERRAEVFSKFLQMIDDARRSMSDTIYNTALAKMERDMRLNELCLPVMSYVRIVRLYLPSDTRDEFYERAKDYVIRYSTPDLGDTRLKKVNEDIDRIQEIFEQELSAYFWVRPIKSRLAQLTLRWKRRKETSIV